VTSPNPVTGVCPATLSAMSVSGSISSTRATSVTYHWARSDGTSSGSVTKSVAAGGSVPASDSVTPTSGNFEIGDTLTVTSPSSHSATAKVAVQCSPVLTVSSPGDQSASDGIAITPFTVPVSGGNGSYNFSISGASWASIDSSGTVTGTPPVFSDANCIRTPYDVTVTVTDTEAQPQSKQVMFTITSSSQCIQ
jgi:hypothetical protein